MYEFHYLPNSFYFLNSRWHNKKIKLHQRLALRLFQEDVKQVLDWLQNHGEVFLRKNVGIGRNLAKARAYQKSHETFEGVVQNTYTNAEKLLAAAAELAQTGKNQGISLVLGKKYVMLLELFRDLLSEKMPIKFWTFLSIFTNIQYEVQTTSEY